ncbi:hypothetical protein [Maribacter aquivivus]|jgi:UDP-N-acetylglucosamine:LPS N-acetylglucosamine transferase|uniref:hypothetical protein n=1 Tax=Maribacter aquivivus TaxID=228958 RepID=UPI0024909F39|nr:hypothetical protein [Maribacter aquivivus]
MIHYFDNLPEKINIVYSVLAGAIFSQFGTNDSIINPEAYTTLKNPVDREMINAAVQELKNDPSLRNKKLTLSNQEELIISVD